MMKVIDKTQYQDADGSIGFVNRIQGTIALGSSWYAEMQAQRNVMTQMEHVLDSRYVLLRNIVLPETDVIIPFILIGPTGIWIMLVNAKRGVFRAKGDSWLSMEGGRFNPAKPNLITRVQLMARAFETYLQKENIQVAEVQPVLLFTNPGMHVDSVHPSVRIVLSDAMERFVASLVQEPVTITDDTIQSIVLSITAGEGVSEVGSPIGTIAEEDDFFAFREEETSNKKKRQVSRGSSSIDSVSSQLSGRQWTALGIVFGLWILVLLVFAVAILFF